MSAIAEFARLNKSKIAQLKEAAIVKKSGLEIYKDNFNDFLISNTIKGQQFDGSGYHYGTLLVFLEEHGIELMQNEYSDLSNFLLDKTGHLIFVFTYAQRKQYENRFFPNKFSEHELLEFNKEFSEDDDPKAGKEMLKAIKVLHDNLKELTEKEILLLSIG